MNPEYINTSGYILLAINILTLGCCLGNSILWCSMCLYETKKPKYYSYMLLMFAVSLCAILANSFALGRMFDSFLVVQLRVDRTIIQSTLIDRAAMFVTFGILLMSGFTFNKIQDDNIS